MQTSLVMLGLMICTTVAAGAATMVPVGAVDQCVAGLLATTGTPGAQVAIVADGVLVYEQGYGARGLGDGRAVGTDTIFRMGSVEKMMTAAAIMQLVEQGLVDLDEPLERWVPEYRMYGPWQVDDISIRQLLTHTSGVPDGSGPPELTGDDAMDVWAAGHHPRLFARPGSFFNYSNLGYTLLGLVVERASGERFDPYLVDRLWRPAGMLATTHDVAAVEAGGNFAAGTWLDPTSGTAASVAPSEQAVWVDNPNGEAFTTAGDLARWAQAMLDGGDTLLTPSSVAAMSAPLEVVTESPQHRYGYGVMTGSQGDLVLKGHGGAVPGYQSGLWWIPAHDFAVAITVNSWFYPVTDAVGCIVEATFSVAPDPLPHRTTDPATWRRYEGRYLTYDEDGSPLTIDVGLLGDRLLATVTDPTDVLPQLTVRAYQLDLDLFGLDLDGDGLSDLAVNFVAGGGQAPYPMWLVNRSFVGIRHPTPVELR